MAKSIEDLEKDLNTMNEIFRKYVKLSEHYQKQVDGADIPEEQRRNLRAKLEEENKKVMKAKMQIETFEKTLNALKESREKVKCGNNEAERPPCAMEYLIAYI